MSDLDLMRIQAGTLYQLDNRNRMLAVNEPGDSPVPRLFLGRTRAGDVWRFRHDLPESLVGELDTMLLAEPIAADLTQPPRCFPALQAALSGDAPQPEVWFGPAMRFPDVLPALEHDVVRITSADDAIVRRVFPVLADDLPWSHPCLAIVRDGRLASVCFSSRNTSLAAEAGVNTLEEFRGRGYAAAVVTAWASAVRGEGRIPLYSTSWDNAASLSVARKLGLVTYGADLDFA